MQHWHYNELLWGVVLSILVNTLGLADDNPTNNRNLGGNLTPSASFIGEFYYERVGYYMDNAGDVNGDGNEDFLIGTFHNRENGYDAGAAYLILGDETNIWGLKKKLREADARFLGKYEYDAFGYYVSGNGDVNGDGYDDFVIGAPAGNELGGANPGYAFLFLGNRSADWGYECVARDQADASFVGRYGYDHLGQSVAIVGDINRDGYDDFIIGAPLNDDGATESGKVYLILGKSSGWHRNVDIELADASFLTTYYKSWAGYTVSTAGDMNGDGFADFLIGSPHHEFTGGRIYLIFGKSIIDYGVNFDLDKADVIFEGEMPGDKAGWSLACAGDVNNDGLSDILIGAYANDRNGVQSGKVYLILGRITEWHPVVNLRDADASWKGEKVDNQAGWSVSGLPDLNYDGCDEILIGAWLNDQIANNCGKAYLIYGRTSGWENNLNLEDISDYFVGEYEGDYAGYCVAGNDANGDGLGDIWISASYNSDGEYRAGKVYLFLSQRDRYQIDGQVGYYSNGNPVPKVLINILGDLTDSLLTDQSGNFGQILPYHKNYIFIPFKAKNADYDSATILAYDAALTLQAAVGFRQLDSLQRLAADVNRDSIVSAFDAALIARYVVGFNDSCCHVGEWIFSPQEKQFLDLDKNYHQQNFAAIIVGNVHGGWQYPDSLQQPLFKIDFPIVLVENNQVKIPIKMDPALNVVAIELKIEYPSDQFCFKEIQQSAAASNFQFMTHHKNNDLSLVAYGIQPIKATGDLITLIFNINNNCSEFEGFHIKRFQLNDFPPIHGRISAKEQLLPIPERFKLYQNFPNPFNQRTGIRISIHKFSQLNLSIYNLNGELVKKIIDGFLEPGDYTFYWDGIDELNRAVSSGIYLCGANCGSSQASFKLLLLK